MGDSMPEFIRGSSQSLCLVSSLWESEAPPGQTSQCGCPGSNWARILHQQFLSSLSRISHSGSSRHLRYWVSPGRQWVSYLWFLIFWGLCSMNNVHGAFWRSANSLKIQSWHLTTWNAEEKPDCHESFCFLCSGISSLLSSNWLLECGRDSCLIHPFSLFVHLAHFMPCPSLIVFLLSNDHKRCKDCHCWAIIKRCKDSHHSLCLESLFCSTLHPQTLFFSPAATWQFCTSDISWMGQIHSTSPELAITLLWDWGPSPLNFSSASKTYLLDQQSLTRLVYVDEPQYS